MSQSLAPLFRIDRESTLSIQEQIRRGVIAALASSVLKPGRKLPSSRALAAELAVSRNTVFLAYQQLIADGHLEARERSGVYVPEMASPSTLLASKRDSGSAVGPERSIIDRFVKGILPSGRVHPVPPDWHKFAYPFIEGRYDRSLFPVAEWREASRLALVVSEVNDWSRDNGEVDDPALVEEIRTKLLPRRGIRARPDELLITVDSQQALFLATQILVGRRTPVAMEEPGLPELRNLLALRGAAIRYQTVDDEGMCVGDRLAKCELVCISPSRQRPTGVTMSLARRTALLRAAHRHDFLILEDDFECEMTYMGETLPALRSLDGSQRVVYAAGLSKVLAPGVGLGYMVAAPAFIAQARRLRDLTTHHPPTNNQRAAAFFLSLGHYDAMMRRLRRVYEERLIALRDALNHYRPLSIAVAPVQGGTSFWVRGPEGLDAGQLVAAAEESGVLIEPATGWFAGSDRPTSMFRLGVTSLPVEAIRPGIERLSRVIRDLGSSNSCEFHNSLRVVKGAQIRSRMQGVTLLYKTVYGDPCTIELHEDGCMSGRAGFAGEDCDTGRWWVEDDRWVRQWRNWAFGEALGFRLAFSRGRVWFLDAGGEVVDTALLDAKSAVSGNTGHNREDLAQ